jgi:4-amino-4-deoxy-L-arabinose transferase-like glycosyltransferase
VRLAADRGGKSVVEGRRGLVRALNAPPLRNAVTLIVLVTLLVGFVVDGWVQVIQHWNAYHTDQTAYLRLALHIQQGVALTDSSRNPLYPAMLAPIAQREWVFFTTAKLLNLSIAVLTLIAVHRIGKQISSVHAALFTVFLLSKTDIFLESATKVVVEPVLTLIVLVTWFLLWKGRGSVRWWGLAGVGAGLAYLAKGTGQIIPIAFVLAAVWIYRTKVFQQRSVWVFLAGYVALAAGLWIHNIVTYGNPFYNVTTSHWLWLDQWEDKYVADPSQWPTALTYLRTHSPAQIARRFLTGLIEVWSSVEQAWFPEVRILLSLCLAVALAALVMRVLAVILGRKQGPGPSWWRRTVAHIRAECEGVTITLVLLALWYLFFAWYVPVAVQARFFLPLSPIVQCGLASALVMGVRIVLDELPWSDADGRAALVNLGYVCVAVLALVATSNGIVRRIREGELRSPFRSDMEQNAGGDEVLAWLLSNADEEPVRVLYGPSKSLGIWRYVDIISHENLPSDLQTWSEAADFIEEQRLSWAIVDFDLVDRRQGLLGDYFSLDGRKANLVQAPPGWVLVHEGETSLSRWFVFGIVQR